MYPDSVLLAAGWSLGGEPPLQLSCSWTFCNSNAMPQQGDCHVGHVCASVILQLSALEPKETKITRMSQECGGPKVEQWLLYVVDTPDLCSEGTDTLIWVQPTSW